VSAKTEICKHSEYSAAVSGAYIKPQVSGAGVEAWWANQCYSRSHVYISTKEPTCQAAASLYSAHDSREYSWEEKAEETVADWQGPRIVSIACKVGLASRSRSGGMLNGPILSSLWILRISPYWGWQNGSCGSQIPTRPCRFQVV
jgi:hypothetical protein